MSALQTHHWILKTSFWWVGEDETQDAKANAQGLSVGVVRVKDLSVGLSDTDALTTNPSAQLYTKGSFGIISIWSKGPHSSCWPP